MRTTQKLLLAATLLASACRTADTLIPASNDVARGVEYTEYDGNTSHPISRPQKDKALVPAPVAVDLNGILDITLHKNEFVRDEVGEDIVARAETVVRRTNQVQETLRWLEAANDNLLANVRAADELLTLSFDERQQTDIRVRLDALIARVANTEEELLEGLDRVFPEDSEYGEEVDAALEEGLSRVLPVVSTIANKELASLADVYETFELRFQKARTGRQLRIEAFLIRGGSTKPVAVHVPGYDDIAAGNVQTIDRLGLRLGPEERERLSDGIEASKELAHAANRIRRKQATVAEAVKGLNSDAAREIGTLAGEVDEVLTKLTRDKLKNRLQALETDARTLLDGIAAEVRTEAESGAEKLKALPDELLMGLSTELTEPITEAVDLFQRAKTLGDELGGLTAGQIPDYIARVREWIGDASEFVDGPLAIAFQTTRTLLKRIDDKILEIFVDELASISNVTQNRWRDSDVREDLVSLQRDAKQVMGLMQSLLNALIGYSKTDDQELLRNARGFDVDLSDAPDSRINLRHIARQEGDELLIKSTLLQSGGEVEESRASFIMTLYGWHADIEPGVVLVEADQLAGSDDSGGFSPTVAWMHSYTPRPGDSGFGNALQRFLDASIGVHAAFLNYHPDNDPQFGLGVSASLWGQRIQLGYGYNLMADDKSEGQYYAYVGSSLFALLQDVRNLKSDD